MQVKSKTVIYCRVSSKEQEETGYSLPAQEKYLREYAEKQDLVVTKVFAISESAAGYMQRKIFDEMMTYVKKHNVTNVVVETTDRLTRNFSDVPLIDKWIMSDDQNQIHLAKETCILHKNSRSHEWFMWRVKVATAEYYVKLLSENVKKGQAEKIAQGWLPTKPPLGYRTVGEKGHKIHVIDEDKTPFIKRMFELYSTGNYSVKTLVEIMYKEGMRNQRGTKVGKSRMHELLTDPFYCGKMRWNGEVKKGSHEPTISLELFDLVQSKINRNFRQPYQQKHLPVFKAKMTCARCEGTVTWETHKGHWYGHCSRYVRKGQTFRCPPTPFIRQKRVEEIIAPYYTGYAPSNERVLDVLQEAMEGNHSEEISRAQAQKNEIEKSLERVHQRMEKIYLDKLDGLISEEKHRSLYSQFKDEEDKFLTELKRLNGDKQKYFEAGYKLHELAIHAEEIYNSEEATNDERRLLLSYIFSNLSLNVENIEPKYSLGFEFMVEWIPLVNSILEPQKNVENKRQKGTLVPSHPDLLRRQDSNL